MAGFETPNNLNDGFNRIENRNGELTAEDEFIWRTTATDGNIEVIHASNTSQTEYGVSEDGESADGTEQFADLNADSPGAYVPGCAYCTRNDPLLGTDAPGT